MTHDWSEWEKERKQREKKAKEVHRLDASDLALIDDRISGHLKDELRRWAAHRWWKLFGSQGHSLNTLEDESSFIRGLDTAFPYPSPSNLLAAPSHARQEYTTREITKRGDIRDVSFNGPPVSRLLSLMLYGFFDFQGQWIYLNRTGQYPNGEKAPEQWHVMCADPTDRLGIRVTVNARYRGRHHPPPDAVFSALPSKVKEYVAADIDPTETHREWLEGIADILCKTKYDPRPPTFLELAGDYELDSYPLADLIANGKRTSGKRVEPVNGNYFDCRPDNLSSRSSVGRKMKCNYCRKPTTAKESSRIKDSTGSTFRICRTCQAQVGRLHP